MKKRISKKKPNKKQLTKKALLKEVLTLPRDADHWHMRASPLLLNAVRGERIVLTISVLK